MILHIDKYGPMNILKNADQKIRKFNSGISPNVVFYHDVLSARGENKSLVRESGRVGDKFLGMIEEALRGYFGMDRGGRMGDKEEFLKRLKDKLNSGEIKRVLIKLRDLCIIYAKLQDYESDVKQLYETLSNPENGLSTGKAYFCVGATKIMHCLFPELFVMLDKYVGCALGYLPGEYNNFEAYWATMNICRQELKEWQELYGSTDSLLELDQKPTTLTRIFDKCASTMGK